MAIGYSLIRFSSRGQADGDSFRRQNAPTVAFCEKHQLDLDTSLHESDVRRLGVSAFKGEQIRKGSLGKFIRLVEAGQIAPGSWLIVEEIDRLTRQVHDQAYDLCLTLMRRGITIATMMDGEVYDLEGINKSLEKRLKLQLRLDAAHEYSAKLSERITASWQARREAMRAGRGKATNACAGWLRAVDGVFYEIPERVAVMKQIIEWRHHGFGRRAIATMLNQKGVKTFRGGDGWHPSTVATHVRNIALIGLYQPRKADGTPDGNAYEGHYPRIISDDDFWRAQWAPDNRRSAGRTTKGHWNLLKGVCKCAWCGCTLIGMNTGKDRFLICDRSRRRGLCGNRYMMTYAPLERELLAALSLFDFSRFLTRANPQADRIEALEAAIAEKAATVDRLLEDFNAATVPEASKRIAALSAEISGLKVQLAEAKRTARIAEAVEIQDAYTEFRTMVARLPDMPEGDELDLLRARISIELDRIIETAIASGPLLTIILKGIETCRVDILFERSRVSGFKMLISGADEPVTFSRAAFFGNAPDLVAVLDQRPFHPGLFAGLIGAGLAQVSA